MKRLLAAVAVLVTLCLTLTSCCCPSVFPSSYSMDAFPTEGEGSTPLLYKATDSDGDAVWLFGSIHVGTDDMYPLPSYVTDAFSGAEGLAVECDVVAAETDIVGMTTAMMGMVYDDGSKISDHISAQLYMDASAILEENSLPASALDAYQPSMWSMMIDSFSYLQYDLDAEKGIDMYLLKRAKNEDIPIHEIESVKEQYDMLGSFSEELQILLLEGSVESYGDPAGKEALLELVDTWTTGNEAALVDMLTDDTTGMTAEEIALYEEYNYAMMTARNEKMTDFAENALIDGNELFICVGAAHVVGPDGMAQQLRERGYTVTLVG